MVPQSSADVLFSVPELRKAVVSSVEMNRVKFHSGMSLILLAVSSMLINQSYILNKVSLNRNTCKIWYCIAQLITMWQHVPRGPVLFSFCSNDDLVFGNSLFVRFHRMWLIKYQELTINQIINNMILRENKVEGTEMEVWQN